MRAPGLVWGAVTVGVVALLLEWGRPFDRPNTTPDSPYTKMEVVRYKGEPAPDFALPTLEGQAVTLSAWRGQAVFLNFWATWCPPCREEMPSIERLHQELKDQGLVILAVDVDESPKLVAKFMRDFRLTFPRSLTRGPACRRSMVSAGSRRRS